MRHVSLILSLAILSILVTPVLAQQSNLASATITCPDGTEIQNGVELKINMRPGFIYTATALGINGFDPVIAVSDANGVQLCQDDTAAVADTSLNLPTTGAIAGSETSARVPFSHNFNGFADISIIVGSLEGTTGEFVLILEGMAVTSADGEGDGAGDPFAMRLTRNMVNSGVPLTVYMLAVRNDLDPFTQLVDAERNVIVLDDGTRVECDDAGNASNCWGESFDLSNSAIGRTPGGPRDSMISISLDGFPLDPDPELNYFNYLMTSYRQASFGDYIVAFHIGIGDESGGNGNNPPVVPTPSSADKGSVSVGISGGVEVTCPDGTRITNGAEVVVNMPGGVSHTATALGIDNFDPVIAVREPGGQITCSDDSASAIGYTANLPSTGFIRNSDTTAQIEVTHFGENYANVSIIVGGFEGAMGEFVLVIEHVDISETDGDGDPYAVRISPNMIASGTPLSIYMLATDDELDPFLQLVDPDGEPFVMTDGTRVECNDAGNASRCFGETSSLVGSFITGTANSRVPGRENSATLSIPIADFDPTVDPDLSFLNFTMSSYQQQSTGGYALVFHIGIGDGTFGAPPSNI